MGKGKGFWRTYDVTTGLAGNSVLAGLRDRDGDLWFCTLGDGVCRYDGETFTTFTAEDGLADNRILSVLQDRNGDYWFGAGGEGGVTRYDGRTFTVLGRQFRSGWTVSSICQDRNGNFWFDAGGGATRYDGQVSSTFTTADGLAGNTVNAIFEDRAGNIWFGTYGGGVTRYDGESWKTFTVEDGLAHNNFFVGNNIFQDRDGVLWFGTLQGVSRYDGQNFQSFAVEEGLAGNQVNAMFQDRSGHFWFGTQGGGVSRYDGQVFQTLTEKDGLADDVVRSITQDRDGALWFGTGNSGVTRFRQPPPSVAVDAVVAERRYEGVSDVAIPSTVEFVTVEFSGSNFRTRPEAVVYRYRLSGLEDWKTTRERRVSYMNLPRGDYTFEVVAVDRDLVYSEAPATVNLKVHLPYERMGLLSALGIAVVLVVWQTMRVIRRDRRLQTSNAALSNANRELFGLNKQLQRESAVERIRAQVQTMERASDFDGVLAVVADDLKGIGLNFDTCGIDILDEAIEDLAMADFEAHGFRYTTYKLDPEGNVTEETYNISAPFPDVTRETIERFLAGEPWQALTGGENAIVEVPVSSHGRLRLTASDRERFTEEEIEVLQDFARAIALGYARYLDFRDLEEANKEIQAQTEQKSAFLASMSHELRTPMNAILGFTRMVLRRAGDVLPEQQKENLGKVTKAGNHLLELINDLLDLSKIEAGGMDVETRPLSVRTLILSCCNLVEPLVETSVALTHDVTDEADEACTDEDKLRHVIGNLLSNARKFTTEGEIAVRARRVHDQLVISVSDTGIGMPSEALETVFDEFQQVKGSGQEQKGTGLGLAITKQYTELLGGTVSVESEVGKGTTFTVQIPAVYREM